MSMSAQVWALHQARTDSATERLILYRVACAHANEDPEAEFYLSDLIEYTGEPESLVRSSLNNLVRKGYIANVSPQGEGKDHFECHLQYRLDDEFIF